MPYLCRHLPKCFDNLHNLEFRKDADGQPTKAAIGMYSGEGEYVAFASDCICDGPVEHWLQVSTNTSVAVCMRQTSCAMLHFLVHGDHSVVLWDALHQMACCLQTAQSRVGSGLAT